MNRKSMSHLLDSAASWSSKLPKMRRSAVCAIAWVGIFFFFVIIAIAQEPQAPPPNSGQTVVAQVPDSQIEADVVRVIGGSKSLKNEAITAATAGGEVTLFGTVSNESARELAETLVARVSGVVRVDNRIKVTGEPQQTQPTNATTAPVVAENVPPQQQTEQTPPAMKDDKDETPQQVVDGAPPPHVQMPPSDPEQAAEGVATPTVQNPQASATAQSADNAQPQQQPAPVQQAQTGRPQYQPGQAQPNTAPQQNAPSYAPQPAPQAEGNYDGAPVTIPAGTLLMLRTSESLDSKHAQNGTMFELTVIRDVYAGGKLAIPRGATVHGVVTQSKKSGDLGGAPVLALQLQSLDLGAQSYTLASDEFKVRGPNKAGYSANNIIGGAGLGALIGSAIGRGPGAAIGAIVGAGTGTAVSAGTPGPRAWIPAEALVTFRLTQPVTVTPVSPQDALRLAQGLFQGGPTLHERRGVGVYAGAPYPYPGPQPFYHPYYVMGGYYYWR